MRIVTTMIVLLFAIASCDAGAASLRAGSKDDKANRNLQLQRQQSRFDRINTAMRSYFSAGKCKVTLGYLRRIVECAMPGYTARFISQGEQNPEPHRLRVCRITRQSNDNCKIYTFNQSTDIDAILKEAFPISPVSPLPISPVSPPDGTEVFWPAFAHIFLFFNGQCRISRSNGQTIVSCSVQGRSAVFVSDGVSEPIPSYLQSCQPDLGGAQSCRTYRFDANTRVREIFTEIFFVGQRFDQNFIGVVTILSQYFDGNVRMERGIDGWDVLGSNNAYTSTMSSRFFQDPIPTRFRLCSTRTGSCQTSSLTNGNPVSLIQDVLP